MFEDTTPNPSSPAPPGPASPAGSTGAMPATTPAALAPTTAGGVAAGVAPAAGAIPISDPGADLDALQKQLITDQAQSASLTQQMDVLKAKITDLQKSLNDINQKKSGYEKALPILTESKKQMQLVFDTLKAELEALVKDTNAVAVTKTAGDKAVTDKRTDLQNSTTAVAAAATTYAAAQAETAAKRAAYDAALNLQTLDEFWLKDLNDLRTQIEKLRPDRQFAHMYFLMLEMTDSLTKVRLPAATEYLTTLNQSRRWIRRTLRSYRRRRPSTAPKLTGVRTSSRT
jgi:chromosome segregation ATPase